MSPAITAAHVAVALIAACREAGLDPAQAFGDQRGSVRARIHAAAGCVARLGWPKQAAARAFKIEPIRLAPSNLAWCKIGTDDLLTIAEALRVAGLTGEASEAPARFRSASPPGKPKARPKPKAVAKPVEARPVRPAASVAAAPSPVRRQSRSPSAPRRIATTPEPARPTLRARSAIEIRPITTAGLRFIRQFLESGAWRIEEVADLFDTHPDAIADALAGPMGVAA